MTRASALALLLLSAFSLFATNTRRSEATKIDALIASVGRLQGGASFIRNGKAYDAATAAKFLRGKWERQTREIATAEEFIERVGTRSSTTGRAYMVRYRDGHEVPVAVFLRTELQKLH
ncbi:MAG TPA: DUF5329 family protein [Thermoanaerobaculia bacterium]|jgi:hypothetical protein|nr:DUF5329 family protein [Thermoanaerobaculia bacterium]